jgi:hypothetical protein
MFGRKARQIRELTAFNRRLEFALRGAWDDVTMWREHAEQLSRQLNENRSTLPVLDAIIIEVIYPTQ